LERHVVAAGVDAMLSTFTTVDIRHLRSLRVGNYAPMIPFLSANSGTLRKVRCHRPASASTPLCCSTTNGWNHRAAR
jgi:hypothetical protein